MAKENVDSFMANANALLTLFKSIPAYSNATEEQSAEMIGHGMAMAAQLYGQIDRCADALERLAAAQEGRLEVERTKAGLMKSALNPEPEKPAILRANFAPPPPQRG